MKPVLTNQGGQAAAFPDTCKTPSPGGPVPIPYPNLIQDSDGVGSSKVTVLNKQTLRKGDEFRMSSGDEAGTAGGGVVSNTIKGAGTITQGYDKVKVEGKDVAYLLVTVEQNGRSPKQATKGKAVKPGQTKVVLRSVKGKKRRVHVKARKFKPGKTVVKPNKNVNSAAQRLKNAKSTKGRIKASEALGDAGARNAMNQIANANHGGLIGRAVTLRGSGVLDVIGFCKDGVILIFEAKGGGSSLGSAVFNGKRYQQGTPQYLKGIIDKMKRSRNPKVAALGRRLGSNLKKIKYSQARTRKNTVVQEFDPRESEVTLNEENWTQSGRTTVAGEF
jgi:hypothetical protein